MGLKGACPLATLSNIYVDISDNNTNHIYELMPSPSTKIVSLRGGQQNEIAVYDIRAHSSKGIFNIAAVHSALKNNAIYYPSILYANRYIIGMFYIKKVLINISIFLLHIQDDQFNISSQISSFFTLFTKKCFR